MRRVTWIGVLLAALTFACESKTPVGPSTVTIEDGTGATTTVPGGGGTTTTAPPTSVSRRYIGASGRAALPVELTLALEKVSDGGAAASRSASLPPARPQDAGPAPAGTYAVTGIYRTGSGGGGNVRGTYEGTLESGQFSGTLSTNEPGCSAEREFSGTLTESMLEWTGGQVLQDCKSSPLSFPSFTMVRGDTLPPTTSDPTTTTQPCTYDISPAGASIGLAGGSASVQVTTQPECGWSAQTFVDWITVQPASGASGTGTLQYTVAATTAARQATLVIAGLPFIVRQEAPAAGSGVRH